MEDLEIQKQLLWLAALEGAGVDNWEGYDIALEIYDEMIKNTGLGDE